MAVASGRSSVGVELDEGLSGVIEGRLQGALAWGPSRAEARLDAHRVFVSERLAKGKTFKHRNAPYDIPVVTGQETELAFFAAERLTEVDSFAWAAESAPVGLPQR